MIFGVFFIMAVVLIGFLAWSSYPWSLSESLHPGEIHAVETQDMMEIPESPSVIKILTFNIGYLYGQGSEGPGYVHRERSYYEERLKKIASEIKAWDADLVFLQEIDFEASRSAGINQADTIARICGYPFVAEAVSWDANYIPFPYWPIKNNFGKMRSGGAILSRYPLSDHEVILLKKPDSNPWWYNLFYLHRYLQKATVSIGDKKFRLINLHLEAFDKVNRMEQVRKLTEVIKNHGTDIVAGDFNMLPRNASKKSKFYNDDDYENDSSFQMMTASGLFEVIPEEIYEKDESTYFTFPAWEPDRRLDFIWFKQDLKMMKAEVLPSASSDHLPLRASFQIDGPRFNPYSQ